MSTLAEIENAIAQLPLAEAEHLQEWLEDQQPMTPEFLASIERVEANFANARHRTVQP